MHKFQVGDEVTPLTLSLQGSSSSRRFVGEVGRVETPCTATGNVRVVFVVKDTHEMEPHHERFVYRESELIHAHTNVQVLEARLAAARMEVFSLEERVREAQAFQSDMMFLRCEVRTMVTKATCVSEEVKQEFLRRAGL